MIELTWHWLLDASISLNLTLMLFKAMPFSLSLVRAAILQEAGLPKFEET